jgi:hypothetical protein
MQTWKFRDILLATEGPGISNQNLVCLETWNGVDVDGKGLVENIFLTPKYSHRHIHSLVPAV